MHLRSCRFCLYIRKIRWFCGSPQLNSSSCLSSHSVTTHNALMAGLPGRDGNPLEMSQSAAACQVFHRPQHAYVKPIFPSPHWLPGAASFMLRPLTLAFRGSNWICTRTHCSTNQSTAQATLWPPLMNSICWWLHCEEESFTTRSFNALVPELHGSIRSVESHTTYEKHLKTPLFTQHLSVPIMLALA